MKKILMNISNHPSSKWSTEQKEGWNEIIDIPFPEVAPEWDIIDKEYLKVKNEILCRLEETIKKIKEENEELKSAGMEEEMKQIFVFVAGEWTITYRIIEFINLTNEIEFKNSREDEPVIPIVIVFPTSKRVVEEKVPDGTVKKDVIFKFVRWRTLF